MDIDLVYTDLTHPDRQSALAAITEALLEVAGLLENKLKVTVRPAVSGSDHESKLFISRGAILLKVEVNHVFRGTVYPIVTGRLSSQAESHFARSLIVPMLDPDELYASKLVALLDRQHPRDLFDVLVLLERGGITSRMRRAFTVYLAGHNRPIHELLAPHSKDIRTEFSSDFAGMTSREVTLEQLLKVREQVFKELPTALDDAERAFLLAVNRCEPDGKILDLPGMEELPAIRWKVQNLKKLAKTNPKKYSSIVAALERSLKK